MSKSVKILLSINIITIIIVIGLYYNVIQLSKQHLNSVLTNSEANSHIGARISELEDKIVELENIVKNNEK